MMQVMTPAEPWNNSGWDQDHVRFGDSVPQSDDLHPSSGPTFWSVRFGGPHPNGFNAAFADGSVRFIGYDVTPTNWGNLCKIADGNPITQDQLRQYLEVTQQMNPVPELHLQPDATARYELVDEVLAVTKRAHVQKMGFVGNEYYQNIF